MKSITILAALLAAAAVAADNPAAPKSRLVFKSRGGTYVTQGKGADLAASEKVTFSVSSYGDGRSGISAIVDFSETEPGGRWHLMLATGDRLPLEVRAYSPASASGGPSHPEKLAYLNFTGCGRGNSSVLGSFEVLELRWGPDGTVGALAVDFTVYEGGQDHRVTWGALRYRSAVPIGKLLDPAPIPK